MSATPVVIAIVAAAAVAAALAAHRRVARGGLSFESIESEIDTALALRDAHGNAAAKAFFAAVAADKVADVAAREAERVARDAAWLLNPRRLEVLAARRAPFRGRRAS